MAGGFRNKTVEKRRYAAMSGNPVESKAAEAEVSRRRKGGKTIDRILHRE